MSFEVKEGEVVGFLGPNGAGKSTTIRCMMDFLRPTDGEVTIFGKNVLNGGKWIREEIGFLSGEVNLYNNWSGKEHIRLIKGVKHTKTVEKELVERLDFDQSKKVKQLSSGNKQKLGLILAFMHNPKLLMLDEPTTGLDPFLQQNVTQLVRERAEQGSTVFLSSHNLAEVERTCDRVIIIKEGKIVAMQSITELKRKKLYTAYVHFDGKPPKNSELESKGISVIRRVNNGYQIQVKGDIDPFLKELTKYKLSDVEILHASLEEIFLEFYQ
ncbi:MAG: ABC transporter ATP-binding protein [Candidatus Dojkabacteria bacterium]|nr:MAG: ABC transporter ATP-binding protein [Candidatus Dojkabacteria bacterium]